MHRDRGASHTTRGNGGITERAKPTNLRPCSSAARTSCTTTTKAEKPEKVSLEASLELEGAEYERFVGNVAASIIQHYWRQHTGLRCMRSQRKPVHTRHSGRAPGSVLTETVSHQQLDCDILHKHHDVNVSKLQSHRTLSIPPETQPSAMLECTAILGSSDKSDTKSAASGNTKSSKEIVDRAQAIVSSAGLRLCPGVLCVI
jgi:hypothetical protein